tara:strand:- start:54 stop:671 length:618 start_codon:yes stop_codon:yes gene_type:complete
MKRIEKKYVLDKKYINHVLINSKAFKEHSSRIINSIYFDTNNFKDYHDNLEGTVPRKKVRIRFYGNRNIPSRSHIDNFHFEIKKTSYSSRSKHSVNIYSKFDKVLDLVNNSNFINSKRYPKSFISYQRDYYKTINNVRITIDKNIVYNKLNSNLLISNKVFEKNFVVEVKKEISQVDDGFEYEFLENFNTKFSKYYNSIKYNYFI